MRVHLVFALLILSALTPSKAVPVDWTASITPFQISDNLYYVGSRDLAAYLIVTPKGNILLNANLESSPPQIRRSVERLGFRWADTRILLSSQAHYDHAAGAATVLEETHARYMVMAGDVDVIQTGGAADFDRTMPRFAPVHVDRVLEDNDTVTLGGTQLTAHRTAGHTRGCTTWTMQTHSGGRTRNVVIVGGWALNAGVSLVPSDGRAAAYPGIVEDFDRTFATLKKLPCDIFLGAHGSYFDMLRKLERMSKEGAAVWVDPAGYRRSVAAHEADYREELARQERHN